MDLGKYNDHLESLISNWKQYVSIIECDSEFQNSVIQLNYRDRMVYPKGQHLDQFYFSCI